MRHPKVFRGSRRLLAHSISRLPVRVHPNVKDNISTRNMFILVCFLIASPKTKLGLFIWGLENLLDMLKQRDGIPKDDHKNNN